MRKIFTSLLLLLALACTAATPELKLPQIPDSLRTATQRAAYLIGHFWDNMDFSDTTLNTDTAFMEQNFANYASLFPHTDIHAILPAAAASLMQRAEIDKAAYNLLAQIADTYLYEPESPVANEEAYRYFLLAITRAKVIDPALMARYEAQLEDVSKNRPGTIATDFEMKLHSGEIIDFIAKCKEAKATLLLFYDPDCGNCTMLVNEMKRDTGLADAIAARHLNIIAVYPEGDETVFTDGMGKIPPEWIDAMSPEGKIGEEELYVLPSLPTLYVIDSTGTVILKNAHPAQAVATAKNLAGK